MDFQHVNVKLYVEGELTVAPARFIDVFQQWVADRLFDELLIDVADYRHVPIGPGVVLVGYEADYSMDNTGNRYGLRYNRKAALNGSNEDRFLQALRAAAQACQLLETQLETDGRLKFSRHEFALSCNDRALAPNTPETYAACRPQLEAFLKNVLGHGEFTLSQEDDPRRLFAVNITLDKPLDLAAIVESAC